VWAKGPPARVESALVASNLGPSYMTTRAHILEDGSVTAAKRSYRYVKLIAAAAAALALVALLLYLQARQRAQLIASALARRMGATAAGDAAALALEAASIMGFAALLGGVVATAAAAPVVVHVDAVPLYAPPPLLVVPYTTLVLGAIVAVAIAALLGALAAAIAMRSDPSEALRVA
jgi:hypothetical protein